MQVKHLLQLAGTVALITCSTLGAFASGGLSCMPKKGAECTGTSALDICIANAEVGLERNGQGQVSFITYGTPSAHQSAQEVRRRLITITYSFTGGVVSIKGLNVLPSTRPRVEAGPSPFTTIELRERADRKFEGFLTFTEGHRVALVCSRSSGGGYE